MREEAKITSEMVILDIISDYPQTEGVFRSFDDQAGECICCQMLFASVEDIIKKYQLDGGKLLAQLNAAAGQ